MNNILDIVNIVIIIGYISIGLELALAHVPSVASNRAIWSAKSDLVEAYPNSHKWIFKLPKFSKVIFFFLPLLLLYWVFLMPILIILGLTPWLVIQVEQSTAVSIISILMMIGGRFITLQAVAKMISKRDDSGEQGLVRQSGLFGYSRNPIQVGMYLFLIGVAIGLMSYWVLIGVAYYIAYMHVKIKMEEQFLLNQYGQKYTDYASNTRRYL